MVNQIDVLQSNLNNKQNEINDLLKELQELINNFSDSSNGPFLEYVDNT